MSESPGEAELLESLRRSFPSLNALEPAEARRRLEGMGNFLAGAWTSARGIGVPAAQHQALAPEAARVAQAGKGGLSFLIRVRGAVDVQTFMTVFNAIAQQLVRQADPRRSVSAILPRVPGAAIPSSGPTTPAGAAPPAQPDTGRLMRELAGYEILQLLGEGAMGRVYKARQKSLDRIVALKVLTPRLTKDTRYVERFHREAKAAATLTHPNVVLVIDQGTDPSTGLHYIAFEFVEGPNLEDLLGRRGKFTEREALELMLGVARGLASAHQAGIVHRDMKPANVLVAQGGVAKLCDLGLAKRAQELDLSTPGTVVGTPLFMSPEQLRGDEIDHRADLYALGLTMYLLLTGKKALASDKLEGLVQQRLTQDCPDPRALDPSISEGASVVVRRLAARDREARYASAADAARDLERLLAGAAPGVNTTALEMAPPPAPRAAGIPPDPPWTLELVPSRIPDAARRQEALSGDPSEGALQALERSADPAELRQAVQSATRALEAAPAAQKPKAKALLARLALLSGDRASAESRAAAAVDGDPANQVAIDVQFRCLRGDAERCRLQTGLAHVRAALAARDLPEARGRAERLRDAFPGEPHPWLALMAVTRLQNDEPAFLDALQRAWSSFPSKERCNVALGGLDGLVADVLVAHGRGAYRGDGTALKAMLESVEERSNLVAGSLRMGIGVARIALERGGLTLFEQRRLHFAIARALSALRRYSAALEGIALASQLNPGELERPSLEAEKSYLQHIKLMLEDEGAGQRRVEPRYRCVAAAALMDLTRARRELAARERAARALELDKLGAQVLELATADPSTRAEIRTTAARLGHKDPFETLERIEAELATVAAERAQKPEAKAEAPAEKGGFFGMLKSAAGAAAAGVASAAKEAQLRLRETQASSQRNLAARVFVAEFAQNLSGGLTSSGGALLPLAQKVRHLHATSLYLAEEEARALKDLERLAAFAGS